MTSELNWKFNILQLLLCLSSCINGIWANPKPEAEDTYYTPYVPPNYVPDQPYPVTPSNYIPEHPPPSYPVTPPPHLTHTQPLLNHAPEPYPPNHLNHVPEPAYPPKVYEPPAYVGKAKPKQNCSVVDEILRAEICTPSFQTECVTENISIKKIITRPYCFNLAKTECEDSEETIENEICVYEYTPEDRAATATTVKVTFDKECQTQMVTVCDPAYASYHGYHHGYGGHCKEVKQTTCYNTPKVESVDVPVSLTFPVPEKKCESKPITIPRVTCQVKTEEKCIDVPDVRDEVQTVEKCSPVVGDPICQKVELVLPKQVCQDVIYGYAHKPSAYEH